MKKVVITSLVLAMLVGLGIALANPGDVPHGAKLIGKVNIIGVKNPKKDNMDDKGGGVIFVDMYGKNKIFLAESGTNDAPGTAADDFVVLDKNATDGDGALLAIPDPDLDPYIIGEPCDADTISAYSVFVRPLGKPSKDGVLRFATITTCADLVDSNIGDLLTGKETNLVEGNTYCSIDQVGQLVTLRQKGKSTFTNVTAELLTIVIAVDILDAPGGSVIDTIYVRIPIFDDSLENEYWEYDNNGLKLLQVRFYDCPTDVTESDIADWK
jgi:hypothetical protein